MNRFVVAALVAALLSSASGCAFSLSGPEPNRPRGKLPECDRSKTLVYVDGVTAVGAGIGALGLISANEAGGGAALAALGVLFVVSAYRGSQSVDQCNDETATFQREVNEDAMARREVNTPPPPDDEPPIAPKRRPIVRPIADLDPQQPAQPTVQQPPVQLPPVQQPPVQAPPKPKQPAFEDWADFWKEL